MSAAVLETLSVGEALRRGAARLRAAGVEAPSRDARRMSRQSASHESLTPSSRIFASLAGKMP